MGAARSLDASNLARQASEIMRRMAVDPPHPDPQTDAYIATQSVESQILVGWMAEQGIREGPERVSKGGGLWVIGHDYEVMGGVEAIRKILARGFDSSRVVRVVLVVCSAASIRTPGISSVAQSFLDLLSVPVYASTTPVGLDSCMPMRVDEEPEQESLRRAGAMSHGLSLPGSFYKFTPTPRWFFPGQPSS
ncbi:hypothetical protein ACFXPT_32735 [Streptomyces goshikiensis]|uniref:hypothetical protein n=1 Tax=Streptomyces goshikiensis TaxID=1942 RepID=UPI003689709F